LPKWIQGLVSFIKKHTGDEGLLQVKLALHKNITFAPIYDNGSSLCRECTHEKVVHMLKNKIEFEAYIKRGLSEIHWEESKITHVEIIKKLLNTEYKLQINTIIDKIIRLYSHEKFSSFMESFDNEAPDELYGEVKLPKERKELITNAVSLRAQKLKELL